MASRCLLQYRSGYKVKDKAAPCLLAGVLGSRFVSTEELGPRTPWPRGMPHTSGHRVACLLSRFRCPAGVPFPSDLLRYPRHGLFLRLDSFPNHKWAIGPTQPGTAPE